MKIFNITKNTILATDAVLASTYLARLKGLLGKKELGGSSALILRPCNAIHTVFMCFAIDVLFVDKGNRVIKVIANLAPFRLTSVYFKAAYTVELPVGSIASSNTRVNDILEID
ncbi:MAG: DUF192 domain-containing protein [Candidatus Omnitrophota bacterium]|nr:DUF192 domain-containing protein [Candidatus Omnitrophota bacterium]